MDEFYIARPPDPPDCFSLDEVVAKLQSGEFRTDDLAWKEGFPDWKKISEIPELMEELQSLQQLDGEVLPTPDPKLTIYVKPPVPSLPEANAPDQAVPVSSVADSCYAFTDKNIQYYAEKFERRVFRRLIEYQILTKHFETDYEKEKSYVSELLGLDEKVIHGIEVKDHIEKACMIGLKAEFELFFTIYCTLVLNHLVKRVEDGELIPKVTNLLIKTVKKDEFANAFVEQHLSGARQIAVEELLPDQGLWNFEQKLLECGWTVVKDELDVEDGWDLGEEFAGMIKTPWKQIQMAFQVRHAIEHNFSKVSDKGGFHYHAVKRGALDGSTWSRWWGPPETQPPAATECGLGQAPKVGDRVLIDHIDIRGTAAAMTWVAKQLTKHWRGKLNN